MRRVGFDAEAIARLRPHLLEDKHSVRGKHLRGVAIGIVFFLLLAHGARVSGSFSRGGAQAGRNVRMAAHREVSLTESSQMNPIRGAVVVAGMLAMSEARGADLLVPEQFQTIVQALTAAQAGDVVSIAPGTYDVGMLLLPNLSITLRGRASSGETVLTGVDVQVQGGASVRTLANLTMRGFTGYGAFHVNGATATLDGVRIEFNGVHGVFLDHSATLNTTNCTIANNPRGAFAYVGCMWNATDCRFESNGYTDAYGGAVGFHIGSGCNFTRCSFIGNTAALGGAIGLSFSGSRIFDDCYFEGNESPDGAVWWTEFGATGTLRNSVLCGDSTADLHGSWVDGGGNQFYPKGCDAELRVPERYPTIAQALSAATDGDVVSIRAGTYDVGSLLLPDVPVTLRGRSGISETVLTGVDVQVQGGASVRTVANLTMRGFTGYGAFHLNGATATLDGVRVEFNELHGIFLDHSATLNTTNCTIADNERGAFAYVGCMWNATDCRFESNGYTVAYGGAVGFHIGSGCNFTRCSFIGNTAALGGAIGLSFSGSRIFDDCYFEGNESPVGAVWWTEFGATGTLRNSMLCGHSQADMQGSWIDGGGNTFVPQGCGAPCPADLIADSTVNGADMAIVLNFWGTDGSQFAGVDLDGDGVVGGADLALILNAWGPCPQ